MRLLLLTIFCLVALVVAQPAGAIVPPRNCGYTTVKGKRYNVKADQLRCNTAVTYSRRYLSSRSRPTGYRCRNYTGTALKFKCDRGTRSFFAIRR